MERWVLEPEYISCIVLAILLIYAFLQRFAPSPKQTVYRASLAVSILAILVNIGSVHCIEDPFRLSMSANYLVSALYFALTSLMIMSIVIAALMLIYEERYNSRGFRVVLIIYGALYALMLALVLTNAQTSWLFQFAADGAYVRGPLNKIGFPMTVVCILCLIVCYLIERKRVNHAFTRILITLPPISVLLGLIQIMEPHVMLTGSASTIALLVLFINGQLQRLNTDQLTELATRDTFYRLLDKSVQQQRPFHVVIISLRNYKEINGRYGQRGGDAFLRAIGAELYRLHNAVACRFTGVEFAVIMREQDAYEERFLQLKQRFERPWRADGAETLLSATFADIAYPEMVSDVNTLIASLEYATRIAKSRGPGTAVRFDKRMKSEFGRRNYIISQLEPAVREDRFYINFQPVYDMQERTLNGAEALVRLNEPESGRPISPGEFIPLAEETGIVVDIGWIVMEKVLRFLSEHPELPLRWVSVNISAQQYQSEGFVERIARLLKQYRVNPRVLKLEITERVLIEDMERTKQIMKQLTDIGVGAGVDDFGTGYSNLSNIMLLPFEVIKIDKSYIDHILYDQYSFCLLETIIAGIRALGMLVLVEGVESAEQYRMIEWLNVDNIQGYYFSKPLPEDRFIEVIRDQDHNVAPGPSPFRMEDAQTWTA